MSTLTKQSLIIRDLEQQIAVGRLRPGQSIPTQKQLMQRYGVAMGTVQQAMAQLQSRGMVVARRGKGTIVSDQAMLLRTGLTCPQIEVVAVGVDDAEDPLVDNVVYAVQRMLRQHGLDLMIRAQIPDSADQLTSWAQQIRAAVVVGKLPPRLAQALRAAGRPVVVFGELYDAACPPGIGQVTVATNSVVELAMACLHMLGHRHIMLVRGDGSYYFQALSQAFDRAATRLGIAASCRQLPMPGNHHHPPVMEHLKRLPRRQWPSVLLIDGAMAACRTIYSLQAQGINVPEDISVFAISGEPLESLPLADLSRSETPPDQIGRRLTEVLLESLRTGVVIRDHVPPRLIRGNTVRHASTPV